MTDNDRTLLEEAARAYWGDEIDDVCSVEWSEEDGAIAYTHADNQDHNGQDQTYLWRPIEDDGDALRLAVKLGEKYPCAVFGIFSRAAFPHASASVVHRDGAETYIEQDAGEDVGAATRRAIVRAAAEIGRSMKEQG